MKQTKASLKRGVQKPPKQRCLRCRGTGKAGQTSCPTCKGQGGFDPFKEAEQYTTHRELKMTFETKQLEHILGVPLTNIETPSLKGLQQRLSTRKDLTKACLQCSNEYYNKAMEVQRSSSTEPLIMLSLKHYKAFYLGVSRTLKCLHVALRSRESQTRRDTWRVLMHDSSTREEHSRVELRQLSDNSYEVAIFVVEGGLTHVDQSVFGDYTDAHNYYQMLLKDPHEEKQDSNPQP